MLAVWALLGTFSLQPAGPQEVVAVWPQELFLSLGWCWSFPYYLQLGKKPYIWDRWEFFTFSILTPL